MWKDEFEVWVFWKGLAFDFGGKPGCLKLIIFGFGPALLWTQLTKWIQSKETDTCIEFHIFGHGYA